MRLFTAIDLPSDVLVRLERLISAFRSEALIKWTPVDNLHITTKFIGEWAESRLGELHDALSSLLPREPFEVELKNLGWFPNERSPRVLWVGATAADKLSHLAEAIDERLVSLGIPREDRPFTPHLTIARIKNPVPLRRLRQKVEAMQPTSFGKFPVSHFSLYRSQPGSNASIYFKLREYRFEAVMAAS